MENSAGSPPGPQAPPPSGTSSQGPGPSPLTAKSPLSLEVPHGPWLRESGEGMSLKAMQRKSGSWVCLDGKAVDTSRCVLCPPFLLGHPCRQGRACSAPRVGPAASSQCSLWRSWACSRPCFQGRSVGSSWWCGLVGIFQTKGCKIQSDRPLSPEWWEPVGSLPDHFVKYLTNGNTGLRGCIV